MEKMIELWHHNFTQSLLIGLLVLLLYRLFRKKVLGMFENFIHKRASKTKTQLDDIFIKVTKRPFRMVMNATVLYIVYHIIDFDYLLGDKIGGFNTFALNAYASAIIVFFAWAVYNATDESNTLFSDIMKAFDIEIDKLMIPFMTKLFRLIIFIVTLAIVADTWGFDVGTFVAGLGIGGLAFALAAKDTLANMFGGAVLITEKPFTIGDWIIVGDVEGTVEDINFRSTKIRKFNKSIVTVPNSRVADSNIINYSKRNIRRISYELKIHIDTPIDSVKKVVKDIEDMLIEHKGVHNETIFVKFNKFGESSLNIFLYYFSNTSIWGEYLSIAEDTNFKIMEILEANEVSLAVPLKQIKVEKESIG
ncbi:mechanosensitive ion channel family protein [Acidaminobacter sp. JC074]|uniref:mechanosensitive ion channel family protein n=1 Tax=Acidaminobacter sp. JC074 TaxID=2530199 RepID=UPI001F109CB2|nr:mechanosensitive ion channel family protein [Acidaminobacter sp. JC074]MCH4891012.1 mechanosensitive ion channel family protein [Acidaminobacter sp. JC074]